jgi:hypothetical protein
MVYTYNLSCSAFDAQRQLLVEAKQYLMNNQSSLLITQLQTIQTNINALVTLAQAATTNPDLSATASATTLGQPQFIP